MPSISIEFLKNINISEDEIDLTLLSKTLRCNLKILKPKILFKKY